MDARCTAISRPETVLLSEGPVEVKENRMGSFFRIAGMLWAALGVANVALNPGWRTSNETVLSIALVFNGVVFVFPGLVILGIGELMYRKANRKGSGDTSRVT